MSEGVLWVNTPIRGEMIGEFEQIKWFLGIGSNSDVVRFLIREMARQITGQQPLPIGALTGTRDPILDEVSG